MVNDILTPMNHREIEYNATKLSGCDIPGSFMRTPMQMKYATKVAHRRRASREDKPSLLDCSRPILEWLDETGKRVFDNDLVMDYGTDCLRLYLMFENTPKENDAPYYDSWQEGALEGIYKFLGRYRRMILAADEWNRRGNYNEETFPKESIIKLNHALEDTSAKIKKYINRGNAMPNRHNIVSALMELLNIYQKELKIGEIVDSLHKHAVETAVPYSGSPIESNTGEYDKRNPYVLKMCQNFIILMAPYASKLSIILWEIVTVK